MRLGVLDIGSNTVHLLLVDAHPGARPVSFASHKRPLQLVSYLDADGAISEAGQDELIGFVNEAWNFARRHGAQDLLAFSTSAIRESANGAEVLARVQRETPVRLEELSGGDEAAMTFLAVRRWYGWGAGSILDLDIGGGSFEMALGQDELPEIARSLPLGAGRLTRDWLPEDPPSPKSIKKLRKYIRGMVGEAAEEFSAFGRPDLVAGTSKTFRSLARIAGAAPSAAGPFVPRVLTLEDLSLWTKRLGALTARDRAGLDGVSALRAPQMLAGALVAQAAMEAFAVQSLKICPWALREGLILRRFDTLRFETTGDLPRGPAEGEEFLVAAGAGPSSNGKPG
ncbi:Ppx/GppA phosphatase family protein [Arthrobacter sp. zg-Y179]|uniref:Ppx/GppA phosphatase family protein n=1 Tax=Arthrobacter sp. zg-Y179 TaxID=2894188 RepID=UPI001E5C4A90|nr:Ppx/GppA phosphatase family protein [Arthrobacter sp. zg-Y179]MCC9173528.1 Ppx/GppA family phosphatase [Arthrobacter sp. zg-Y179]